MRLDPFDQPRMGGGVVARPRDRVVAEIARGDFLPHVAQAREAAMLKAEPVAKKIVPR